MTQATHSQPVPAWRFVLIILAGLGLTACDHAKDLVEQGKKQAADLQSSIEGQSEKAATSSAPAAGSAAPATTIPAATTPTPALPAASPAEKDYGLLVEQFMKIDGRVKSDQMLVELGAMPDSFRARLTECNLTGSPVTDVGLAEVAKFPNLITMNLSFCAGITDNGLSALQGLANLEVLMLDDTKVTDAGMVHLRELAHLKVLNLSKTAVSDAGIARLKALPELEELYLSSTSITGSGFRNVPLGTSLRILVADHSGFGIAGLNGLRAHKNLEQADLYAAQVSDKTVGGLKGCGKLRKLRLSFNGLTDVGVKQLTGLNSLEELNLGGNPVTDNGLTAFKVCKNLKYLGELETNISPNGRAAIAKIAPGCRFDR